MPTTTPSASSVTASAAQALFTSLSSGSGVDTASLVSSLVQAQFAAKTGALTQKSDAHHRADFGDIDADEHGQRSSPAR